MSRKGDRREEALLVHTSLNSFNWVTQVAWLKRCPPRRGEAHSDESTSVQLCSGELATWTVAYISSTGAHYVPARQVGCGGACL